MNRQWKNGDMYVHGNGVYIYTSENEHGIRLNDAGRKVEVAAAKWWAMPSAIYVCNINDNLLSLADEVLRVVGERHE